MVNRISERSLASGKKGNSASPPPQDFTTHSDTQIFYVLVFTICTIFLVRADRFTAKPLINA